MVKFMALARARIHSTAHKQLQNLQFLTCSTSKRTKENIPTRTGGSSAAAAIIARKLAQQDTRTSFYIGVILFVWTKFYVYERTTSKKIQKSNKAKMGNKFFFVASMVRRRWATISTDGDG